MQAETVQSTTSPEAQLALGAPLSAEQVRSMVLYAENTVLPHDTEMVTLLEEVKATVPTEYEPRVGELFVRAIGSGSGIHLNGLHKYSSKEEIHHAVGDETEFQRLIAENIMHGHNAVVEEPDIYKTFAGEEAFNTALDDIVIRNPASFLANADKFVDILPPDKLKTDVHTAFADIVADPEKNIGLYTLSKTLVATEGRDVVRAEVDKSIDEGHMLSSHVSDYEIGQLIQSGVVSDSEAFAMSLEFFESGKMSAVYIDRTEAGQTPEGQRKIIAVMRRIVANEQTSREVVTEIVNKVTPLFEKYDTDIAADIIASVREVHGDVALLERAPYLDTILEPTEIKKIYGAALQELGTSTDETERTYIATTLVRRIDTLPEDMQYSVADTLLEVSPIDFIDSFAGKFSIEDERPIAIHIHQKIQETLPTVAADLVLAEIKDLHKEFNGSDELMQQFVISRIPEAKKSFVVRSNEIKELLTGEQQMALARAVIGNNLDEGDFQLSTIFSDVMQGMGIDTAKELFTPLFDKNTALTLNVMRSHSHLFSEGEMSHLVETLLTAGEAHKLAWGMKNLAFRIPKDTIMRILEQQIENSPWAFARSINEARGVLSTGEQRRLIESGVEHNPAAILSEWDLLPIGIIDNKQQVIDYMAQDERAQLLPKYFTKLIRRLPAADGSTEFAVMIKEAAHTYAHLEIVLKKSGGVEMFSRIKASAPKTTERSELDALYLAAVIANRDDIDPGAVYSALDAKVHVAHILNTEFELLLDTTPPEVEKLEAKLGSLVPVTNYMFSLRQVKPESVDHIRDVLQAVSEDRALEWKYGDLEQNIEAGILPRMTAEQYDRWKDTTIVTSTEVSIGGAESVANHIHRVMMQNANLIKGLEKLSEAEKPDEVIAQAREEIGQLGARVADVHKARGSGELGQDAAARELQVLQGQKAELEYAVNVLRLTNIGAEEVTKGILFNEDGKATKVTIDRALKEVVDHNGQAGLEALAQIQTVLDNFREQESIDIGEITLQDRDDFQTTIEVGANPVGTCQHYASGMYREGLAGYFDPNVKIVTVANQRGRYIARAVARLVSATDGAATMVLEPTYTSQASDDVLGAVTKFAAGKAAAMGIPLFIVDPKSSKRLQSGVGELRITGQRAPHIYSDVFGGIRDSDEEGPRHNTKQLVRVH